MADVNPIEYRFKKITKYHIYFMALYFGLTRFPMIWHLLNFIFLGPPMTYTCMDDSKNATRAGVEEVCPCANPKWDNTVFTNSIQMKYGLYCDKKWLVSMSSTICMFGVLVGSFLFGTISDKFGRLPTLLVSNFILATSGWLVAIMPTYILFVVMRFIEGVGTGGGIVSGYVLCIEYCGINYRETVSAVIHLPINVGHIVTAGISYVFRDCDHFQIAISIPMYFSMIYLFLLHESPKWLLDNNHREKCIVVLQKVCKFNNGTDCDRIRSEVEGYRKTAAGESLKFFQIFKYKQLTKNLLCMTYLFFVAGLCYYGLTQLIGKLSGNIHVNTVVGGSFLVPGTFLSMYLINKLKRRILLMAVNFVAGCFMIIMMLVPANHWSGTLCAGIANSAFYMDFTIVFLYCMELFPTSARNSALGFGSVVSRIGQMMAPQINQFPITVSGTLLAVCAFLAIVFVYPLPETKGRELPSGYSEPDTKEPLPK